MILNSDIVPLNSSECDNAALKWGLFAVHPGFFYIIIILLILKWEWSLQAPFLFFCSF